jgi:hypothetical protein
MEKHRGVSLGRWLPALILALAPWAIPLRAQLYSGLLTGIVTDPTHAAVPAVKLTLTDRDRGFVFASVTGSDGRYVFRNLPPGNYDLFVSSPGMRDFRRSDFVLNVGDNVEADVDLQLATSVQTVDVAETPERLSTQDAVLGQVVTRPDRLAKIPR